MKNSTHILAFLLIGLFSIASVSAQYNYLGVVGDAVPTGWITEGDPMTQNPGNPNIFSYEGVFKPGTFKIHTEESADWCAGDWIRPDVHNQSITETSYIVTSGCPDLPENPHEDFKWQITEKGSYSITVDLTAETIVIEPLDYYPMLFLAGDAISTAWDLGQAVELTADPVNPADFTWTGTLSEGSFKIGTARTFDGGWDWIHPLTQGQSLSSSSYEVVEAGSGTDNKWEVDATTAGEYSITVNLAAESVSFEKSPATSANSFQKTNINLVLSNSGSKLITSGIENYDFVIYNLSGTQVKNGFCGDGIINVSNLKSGVYVLIISSVTDGNRVFKFVKN